MNGGSILPHPIASLDDRPPSSGRNSNRGLVPVARIEAAEGSAGPYRLPALTQASTRGSVPQLHHWRATMRILAALALASAMTAPLHAQLAPLDDSGMTFGHVHLNVSDIEVHKQFWAEHFGGEVVQRGPLTAIKFPSLLLILSEREPTGSSQGTVMDHFGFKVRSVASVLEKWRAAGLEVQSEFTGAEGFPNAYLMGPDGVRIELQEDPTMDVDVLGYHVRSE